MRFELTHCLVGALARLAHVLASGFGLGLGLGFGVLRVDGLVVLGVAVLQEVRLEAAQALEVAAAGLAGVQRVVLERLVLEVRRLVLVQRRGLDEA